LTASEAANRSGVGAADVVPLCVPHLSGNEWTYVKECLDSNWVSSVGAYVERFEQAVAQRVGARYAVATVNGTAALHTALLVAGIEPGDEVLVPALTFIAPANAVRYVGAWPVFIDAEPEQWQMDPVKAIAFLEGRCATRSGALYNRTTGRRVRGILPVHILGHPVDMGPLLEAAQAYGLAVVEDATESLGAEYRGRHAGHLGDVGCFSFNGNKMITTGGGGMLVTDDAEVARKAKYLTTQAKDDPVEYVHRSIGYNYRLTNLQAALGVGQLERFEEHVAAKRRIAAAYGESLGGVPGVTCMREARWARSVWWMYTILIDEEEFGVGSRALMTQLDHRGIQTRPLWQPLNRSVAHAASGGPACPVAERLHQAALSLPCSVGLSADVQRAVIEEILDIAFHAAH